MVRPTLNQLVALLLLAVGLWCLMRGARWIFNRRRGSKAPDAPQPPPGRLEGESVEAMIARYVATIRGTSEPAELTALRLRTQLAFEAVSAEELRPVFALVKDPNATLRQVAGDAIARHGDAVALAALREAKDRYSALAPAYIIGLITRGGEELQPEKERYYTHIDASVRLAALEALTAAPDAASGERLVRALAVEDEREVTVGLLQALLRQDRLALLVCRFAELPARTRRALARGLAACAEPKLAPARAAEQRALLGSMLGDADPRVAGAALRTLRSPAFMALRAELVEQASAVAGATELAFATERAKLPAQGGVLALEKGEFRGKVRCKPELHEGLACARVTLVFADSEGREWQLESYISAHAFTAAFEDDDSRAALERQHAFVFWRDAPPAWKTALRERCLLASRLLLRELGVEVYLGIGTQIVTLLPKQQAPTVDVAVLGSALLVRVSGLAQSTENEDGADDEGSEIDVPAFAWVMQTSALLCFSEPPHHYAAVTDLIEGRAPAAARSRAKRLSSKGKPQAGVVFSPRR